MVEVSDTSGFAEAQLAAPIYQSPAEDEISRSYGYQLRSNYQ
jgi:hypothetical protein